MDSNSIRGQIYHNAVALISLVVAVTALTYDTWRNELTEKNRNIRVAAFDVLTHLGELQKVVNYAHYEPKSPQGNPLLGWSHIAMIGDLAQLLPEPAPERAQELVTMWSENLNKIQTDPASADKVSDSIDRSRLSIVDILYKLK